MSEQTTERRSGYVEYTGKLSLGRRVLRYTTVVPTRNSALSGELVMIVPGFLADKDCYIDAAHELTTEGHVSVLISHEDAHPKEVVEDVEETLYALTDGRVRGAEFEHVHGLGHSLGAKYLLNALTNDTHGIQSFLPMAPAGYGGIRPDRALWSIGQEMLHMGKLHLVKRDLLIARNSLNALLPGRLHGQHAAAMYALNVEGTIEMTQDLAAQNVRIVPITHRHDLLIDPTDAAQGLRKAGLRHHVPVNTKYATHNAQLHDPVASASAIDRAIFQKIEQLPEL